MIKAKFVNLAGRKFTKVFKGRDLEDTVFPDLQIEQEFLKLGKEA